METDGYSIRRDELLRLKDFYAECDRGSGRVVVINGPIGNESTILLQSYAQWAADSGALVLTATGSQSERSLPLGIIGQLVRSSALPDSMAETAEQLLGDGLLRASGVEEPQAVQHADARLVHSLASLLLDLARGRTLVISIDDLRHADAASVQILLYLQRRMRSARIMLVLNQWTSPRPTRPLFDAELFRQPHCRRIQLGLLSPVQVLNAVRERLGDDRAESFATSARALTGGNQLLLSALIDDTAAVTSPAGHSGTPVTGAGFTQAVLTCLHGWETVLVDVARASSVLGASASVRHVARLLQIDSGTVDEALSVLRDAGLVEGARFRHEALRDVVVESTSPEQRGTLNLRAARLLHKQGADAPVIAHHLIAAGDADDGTWSVPVLRAAADQALVDDQVQLAVDCLELATTAVEDDELRTAITAKLMHTEWRVNPSAAARHLPALKQASAAGTLGDTDLALVAGYLLWHGRTDDVVELLDGWEATHPDAAAQLAIELRLSYPTLLGKHPGLLAESSEERHPMTGVRGVPAGQPRSMAAAAAFISVLENSRDEDAVRDAQRLLQGCRLDERTIKPVITALQALVRAGQLDDASRWYSILLQEAGARGATTWRAQLEAVAGDIALRLGDLAGAEDHAQAALDALSRRSWGTGIGQPVSVLLLTYTTLGRLDDAEALLRRAVPQSMFDTTSGLAYLYARGQYHLATGHAYMAIDDFIEIGEKLNRWRLDYPTLLRWRGAAAEAYLSLGMREPARQLAEEELRLAGPNAARVRGTTLRVLAKAGEVAQRPALLRDSVELLQQCGDKLQLAYTHEELSKAYRALGDYSKSDLMAERAAEFVNLCGIGKAMPEQRNSSSRQSRLVMLPGPRELSPSGAEEPQDVCEGLSNAERRVAGLATLGHSNREIGRKLFITVSTVEQHLTRVYRKLNVQRRAHLPAELSLNMPDLV